MHKVNTRMIIFRPLNSYANMLELYLSTLINIWTPGLISRHSDIGLGVSILAQMSTYSSRLLILAVVAGGDTGSTFCF